MADRADTLLPFAARHDPKPKPGVPPEGDDTPEELVAPGQAFATVTGQRSATALEFIRRDGRAFCMPYSYAPLLWWQPPGVLILEYPGFFSVVLRGSHLSGLYRRIRDRRVTWICETGEIDAAGTAAIHSLEILHAFPSREDASEPPAD